MIADGLIPIVTTHKREKSTVVDTVFCVDNKGDRSLWTRCSLQTTKETDVHLLVLLFWLLGK